jgi:hypothetical protein
MRPLSKEAETKLLTAIEKAAELVNKGTEPDTAIVKTATEYNIPAGQINLMVHAYNTGRTTTQRESGESTLEKAADFKLANAESILETLYPKAVKTAAEITRENTVSTEYAVSPTGFLARRKAAMQKAAAALVNLPEHTYTPPPRDEHAAVMREASKKAAEKRAAEEIRRRATEAYGKAANAMEALENYFRTPGNMSFGDALKEAEYRLGNEGVTVLKKLAAVYPWLEKQAATGKTHFGHNQVYSAIKTVLEKLAEYKTHQAAFNETQPAPKTAAQKPEVTTGSILHNPLEEPLELKKAEALPSLPTGPVSATRALGQSLYEGANSYIKSPDEMRNDAFKDITDPDHERKLRNIRAQGVLADLVTNDPVISGHDPREVANAFNELAEVAPNFMDSSATVQALLRKRLEAGQLADFDIKQLLELEKMRAEKQRNLLDAQSTQTKLIS